MIPKTIAISLAPNNFLDDVQIAVKELLSFSSWKEGREISLLEEAFKLHFNGSFAFSFNSGRAALEIGLKALHLPQNSEVLVAAFSCVVVANSIRFAGLKPIFVDIKKGSFSIDPKDLERKITRNSRAIIIQNLFGIPDDLEEIFKIAKKNKLIIIEDCAQALGALYKNKKIGQFGSFSFFSFGRDKVISSTFGGMLVTNDRKIAQSINKIYQEISFPTFFWIFRQLLHPIIFFIIVPTYFWFKIGKFSLGKFILFILQKSRLLDFPVKENEKKGIKIADYPKRLPNALATLALHQFKKLDKFNNQRIKIAQLYFDSLSNIKNVLIPSFNLSCEPIFLRFPILVPTPEVLIKKGKENNIFLGNWYNDVIAPKEVDKERIGYKIGSCPRAEKYSQMVVNLPTYPKMTFEDAEKVIKLIKNTYANSDKRNH